MTRCLLAVLSFWLMVAPSASALATLPAEPETYRGFGTDMARFLVRLRLEPEQGTMDVTASVHPRLNATVRAAPGDGAPGPPTNLSQGARFTLDAGDPHACWRGWCGVYTLHVAVPVPNRDGRHRVVLTLVADGEGAEVPLWVEARAQSVAARESNGRVVVEAFGGKPVDHARLTTGRQGWPLSPQGRGLFTAASSELPVDTPLWPEVVFADGARLTGEPVSLTAAPAKPTAGQLPEHVRPHAEETDAWQRASDASSADSEPAPPSTREAYGASAAAVVAVAMGVAIGRRKRL